jgi:2,3-bisphosphoglycerate-dependent phosphoglycerate mutase
MTTLVLLRHGKSSWNRDNRFTGWFDAELTAVGEQEMREAARLLSEHGAVPIVVHTSVLSRCIRSVDVVLDELGGTGIPTHRSWRLNERHYGALQGLHKKEAVERFGAEQVQEWRRSFDVPPPPLALDDERHPRLDPRYHHLPPDALPASESLKDVVARVVPYWQDAIAADLIDGRAVLVVGHGNSLRALVMHLLGLTPAEVAALNIATGQPWCFEFDESLHIVHHGYLDAVTAERAARAVSREAG